MKLISLQFSYEKSRVLQALRYHFITRKELRLMLIVVNVFALGSITLYALKLVTPLAFLTGSLLWLILMISFWFIMPSIVYRQTKSFLYSFTMEFNNEGFSLSPANGLSKQWGWTNLNSYLESPHFFHLYFDAKSFFIVPKEGMPDNMRHELRGLLNKKIGA